ncbi:hypothetical protein WDZ92_14350, partial [Nostoc sp. NIES-2111]
VSIPSSLLTATRIQKSPVPELRNGAAAHVSVQARPAGGGRRRAGRHPPSARVAQDSRRAAIHHPRLLASAAAACRGTLQAQGRAGLRLRLDLKDAGSYRRPLTCMRRINSSAVMPWFDRASN